MQVLAFLVTLACDLLPIDRKDTLFLQLLDLIIDHRVDLLELAGELTELTLALLLRLLGVPRACPATLAMEAPCGIERLEGRVEVHLTGGSFDAVDGACVPRDGRDAVVWVQLFRSCHFFFITVFFDR